MENKTIAHAMQEESAYRASLDALPLKVLRSICGSISPEHIKNFRSVCRLFATVGSEYLAKTAYLRFSESSFRNLYDLADTPLSKNIKSLFFAAEDLDHCHNLKEWYQNQLLDGDRSLVSLGDRSDTELQGYYSHYRQSFSEQEHLMQNEFFHQECLRKFFENCTMLDSLAMSFAQGISLPSQAPVKFSEEVSHIGSGRRAHSSMKELADTLRMAEQADIQFKHFAIGYLPLEHITPRNPHFHVIKAAMSSLESLVLGLRYASSAPSLMSDSHHGYTDDDVRIVKQHAVSLERDLCVLISAATNLRHLQVKTQRDPERDLSDCLLNRIFDVHEFGDTLPNLCSLSLQGIILVGQNLYDFLVAHKNNIKYVRLQDVRISDDSSVLNWCGLLAKISTKLPNVRKFLVHGDLRDGSNVFHGFGDPLDGRLTILTHNVDKYIRKGGPHPLEDAGADEYYIPNHVVVYQETPHSIPYIENPDTETEDFDDEDEEQFRRMHD